MNITVLFSLYPKVIALPRPEYHVYVPSQKPQKGSAGSSITIKSVEVLLYEKEQHREEQNRLRSILLLKGVFVWISEVYKIKRSTEMVNRNWSSLRRTGKQ